MNNAVILVTLFVTHLADIKINGFYRAAWNATRSYDEISVCLSVCPSVRPSDVWIVIKRKKNQSRFLYHAKEHSL